MNNNVVVVGANVLLKLPSAVMEEYKLPSGIYVAKDPEKRVEENAQTGGEVIAVGSGLVYPLSEGDQVVFNYTVVADTHNVGGVGGRKYSNSYNHIEGEMWFAAQHTLIAVKREGKWQALGQYVVLEPISNEQGVMHGSGVHVSGVPNVDEGTVVLFDMKMGANYEFPDKKSYVVVPVSAIRGYEVPTE